MGKNIGIGLENLAENIEKISIVNNLGKFIGEEFELKKLEHISIGKQFTQFKTILKKSKLDITQLKIVVDSVEELKALGKNIGIDLENLVAQMKDMLAQIKDSSIIYEKHKHSDVRKVKNELLNQHLSKIHGQD